MDDIGELKAAGGRFNTIFWCCLLSAILGVVSQIPMVGIIQIPGQLIIMTIMCFILHRLGWLSTKKKWTKACGTAKAMALINLFIYIVIIGIGCFLVVSYASDLQRLERLGDLRRDVATSLLIIGLLALVSVVLGIIEAYMILRMCSVVGEELSSKKLVKQVAKASKWFTILIVAGVVIALLSMTMSVVLPNKDYVDKSTALAVLAFALLVFIGFLVLIIYTFAVFLGALQMTSSTLLSEARKLGREAKKRALEEKQAAKIAEG